MNFPMLTQLCEKSPLVQSAQVAIIREDIGICRANMNIST